jgi:hypothetical protein
MPKIEINQVAEICKRNQLDPDKLRAIVEEMNILAKAEVDEEKPPALKKQSVILISDPDGTLPNRDYVGWVLQIPDSDSPVTVKERVYRACYEFNATKKGRLLPVRTVGEALENIQAKHFKEAEVWVKTKTPVLVVVTDNKIPRDKSTDARKEDDDE